MKFRIGLSVLALLASLSASAATKRFTCDSVDGVDEYVIYVELDRKQAGFFDNDSTIIAPLKKIRVLETMPSQKVYVFEGKERDQTTFRIEFNRTKMTGSITFDVGLKTEETHRAHGGCQPAPDLDINGDEDQKPRR